MTFRARSLVILASLWPLAGCSDDPSATVTPDATMEAGPVTPDATTYQTDGGDTSCGQPTAIACDQSLKGTNEQGANSIHMYLCTALLEAGPESYYSFTTAEPKIVTVDLTPMDVIQDLDLFVLGEDCDATECLDRSVQVAGVPEQVRFPAAADEDYRIVVDGYVTVPPIGDTPNVGVSAYTLAVACSTPSCTPSETSVGCFTRDLAGNNSQSGSTDDLLTYGCGGDDTGPEYAYTFVSPINGQVTITLDIGTPSVTDLDLVVLEDKGGGCSAVDCVDASFSRLDEQVFLQAVMGTTYYIVVDGFADSQGEYDLSVECEGISGDAGLDGGMDGPTGD